MTAVARGGEHDSAHEVTSEPARPTFADQFTNLLRDAAPGRRQSFPLTQLSRGIVAMGGPELHETTYHALKTGRNMPSLEMVQWIAKFFGVPLTYFEMDGPAVEDRDVLRAQQELIEKIRRTTDLGLLESFSGLVDRFLTTAPTQNDRSPNS